MDRDRFAEDLGVVAEDVVVHHVFVGVDVDVGKDQAGDHADDQRYGELLEEVYVVRAEQSTTLFDKSQGGPPFYDGTISERVLAAMNADGANARRIISPWTRPKTRCLPAS